MNVDSAYFNIECYYAIVLYSYIRLLHSVATALMASTNDWYLNIGKGKYTGLIFIDFKTAFDMVDHEILLKN